MEEFDSSMSDELPDVFPDQIIDRVYAIIYADRHQMHLRRVGKFDDSDTGNPIDITIITDPAGEYPPEFKYKGKVQ